MKSRFIKFFLTTVLICALVFSMAGCEKLDYRKAIKYYNTGSYEMAAEVFYQLGNYERSQELYTDCQYWIAANLAQQGKYPEALPRFLKLGEYENSTQWVTECNYQIALAAFDEGRFSDAAAIWQEIPDYKQSAEYLRRIHWLTLFDSVNTASSAITTELDEKCFCIYSIQEQQQPDKLVLSVEMYEKEAQLYGEFLTITLTRDSTVADFTCGSDFRMDYVDGQIGSSQSGSGRLDITTCTPQTILVLDAFEKTVTDNLGNTTTSQNPADSLMKEQMIENLGALLTVIPELLEESGISVTLQDIGFTAL